MRHGERGTARHQHPQRVADQQLGFGIHARGGLVEDQHGRIECQRPGERQQLLLPDRERGAPLRDGRIVAARQRRDEAVRVHRPGGLAHPGVGDVVVAEADVAGDRAREQMNVLQHEPEQPAQPGRTHVAHIGAVHDDPSARHVVEPQQQADQGRLARAGRPDDADALSGPDLERDVPEHRLGAVGEGHMRRRRYVPLPRPPPQGAVLAGRQPPLPMARSSGRPRSAPAYPGAERSAPTKPWRPAAC